MQRCIVSWPFFSPHKSWLSHSNQRQDALTNAQFHTDIRSLEHTWLSKIKQVDFMKSSFFNLCTLVQFSVHLEWSTPNQAQSNRHSDILLSSTMSFFSCIAPPKVGRPLPVGWRVTWDNFQCAFETYVSARKECKGQDWGVWSEEKSCLVTMEVKFVLLSL